MKLAHVRQRFAADEPPPRVRESLLVEMFCTANPRRGSARCCICTRVTRVATCAAEYKARCEARRNAGVAHTPIAARPIGWRIGADVDDAA